MEKREPVVLRSTSEKLKDTFPYLDLSEAANYLAEFDRGQTDGISCWRSPLVERKGGSKIEGVGLFATQDIESNVIIAIKPGHVVGNRTIKENSQIIQGSHQQIGKNDFLTGLTPEEVDKNLVGYNHSCDPNAKIIILQRVPLAFMVTKKPIRQGEEITTDYSVSQSSNTHRLFICKCGSTNCREIIQPGYDWLDADFQNRHFDEFPYFIREEIEEMSNMPQPRLNAKKRFLYTLQMADVITLLTNELARRGREMDRIVQGYHGDEKLARKLLKRLSRKDTQKYQDLLLKSAQLFAQLCTLANIEEMGIDRNNPETIIEHLPELVELAKHLDTYFN